MASTAQAAAGGEGSARGWREVLPIAVAVQSTSRPIRCASRAPGERIAIAGSRDDGAWLVGCALDSGSWGLFPADRVVDVPLMPTLRAGSSTSTTCGFTETKCTLDDLLDSAGGDIQAVYDQIERAFGHNVLNNVRPEECRLQPPRQVTSSSSTISVTWATRAVRM